jgi:hypothetical protein
MGISSVDKNFAGSMFITVLKMSPNGTYSEPVRFVTRFYTFSL